MPVKPLKSSGLSRLLFRSSLFFLILIACIGLFLRTYNYFYSSFPYTNFLHAHSHGAFLGWVFLAINALVLKFYIKPEIQIKISFIFWIDIVLLFIMPVSFSVQGYGVVSIIISSLHIFLSWYISVFIIREIRTSDSSNSELFMIKWSFIFQIVSGLFPLLLGFVVTKYGVGSIPYFNTIYTYLHFQYNGFFILIIISFLIRHFQTQQHENNFIRLLEILLVFSVPLTLCNSFLWAHPSTIIYNISLAGALIQLIAACGLMIIVEKTARRKNKQSGVFYFFAVLLVLKCLMQLLTSFPYFSEIVTSNRYYVIFYLHFVLLGLVTIPLLYFFENLTNTASYKPFSLNMKLIMFGFLGSETGLLLKGFYFQTGIGFPSVYAAVIIIFSGIMVGGIGRFIISFLKPIE